MAVEKCYACGGSGIIVYQEENDEGEIEKRCETCPRCGGSGKIETDITKM